MLENKNIAIVGDGALVDFIKLDCSIDFDTFNNDNLHEIDKAKYDKIIILKGNLYQASLLSDIASKCVLWYPDNPERFSGEFEEMIKLIPSVYLGNWEYDYFLRSDICFRFMPFGIVNNYCYSYQIKDIDICFVGTLNHPDRIRFVDCLGNTFGDQFKLIGNCWPNSNRKAIYSNEWADVMNRTKVVPNIHYNKSGPNMRFFESLAAGCLLVTDAVYGLDTLNDDLFYLDYEYRNFDDMIKQCKFALRIFNHPETQTRLRNNVRIMKEKHRYVHRLVELTK